MLRPGPLSLGRHDAWSRVTGFSARASVTPTCVHWLPPLPHTPRTLTLSHTLTPSRGGPTHSQLYLLCDRRPWKPGQLECCSAARLLPFWSPRALVTSGVSRREVEPPPLGATFGLCPQQWLRSPDRRWVRRVEGPGPFLGSGVSLGRVGWMGTEMGQSRGTGTLVSLRAEP